MTAWTRVPRWIRVGLGVVTLFVLGQALIVLIGSLAPGLVRDPGWGVLLSPDSMGYLRLAEDPSQLTADDWSKIGYLALLIVGDRLGDAAAFAVAIQSATVIAAGLAFYDLGRRAGNVAVGWLAAALYLLNPLVSQWTRYVLTEPLFYAGLTITLWAMLHAWDRRRPGWWVLWLAALTVATVRPNAIVVPFSVATFLVLSSRPRRWPAMVAALWLAVLLLGAFSPTHASGGGGPENSLAARTYVGEVIWGLPDQRRPMPAPVDVDDQDPRAFLRYVATHPLAVADLGARRVGWALVQVRPHYPTVVNLGIGGAMLVLLSAGVLGWRRTRDPDLTRGVSCLAIPLLALIAMTWAVPEGRFGWGVYVLCLPWIARGLADGLHRASPSSNTGD